VIVGLCLHSRHDHNCPQNLQFVVEDHSPIKRYIICGIGKCCEINCTETKKTCSITRQTELESDYTFPRISDVQNLLRFILVFPVSTHDIALKRCI
jgi:hypothetical protein